jgi:hypothetical protein
MPGQRIAAIDAATKVFLECKAAACEKYMAGVEKGRELSDHSMESPLHLFFALCYSMPVSDCFSWGVCNEGSNSI